MTLSERKNNILSTVIKVYLTIGEPVGSKALMVALGGISSATIRNEMSDLTDLGLLVQPHTSAGRIPTLMGLKYYIDNLMKEKELNEDEKSLIDSFIPQNVENVEVALEYAAKKMSRATRCATLVTTQKTDSACIKRIELIPVGRFTAMMVLVISGCQIYSHPYRFTTPLNEQISERFISLANERLSGTPINSIQPATFQTIAAQAGEYMLDIMPLLSCLEDIVKSASQTKAKIFGEANLFDYNEFSLRKMRDMADALAHTDALASFLEVWNKKDGIIVCGTDTDFDALDQISLVVSKYNIADTFSGYIGVIGPTRIEYAKVLPTVRYLASCLGKIAAAAD